VTIAQNLTALAARWKDAPAAERAHAQMYLAELCAALDVPGPDHRGSGYEFELPIPVVNPDGSTTTKAADLYKRGHFLLEAKQESAEESREILLRRAFGQARLYAAWVPGEPPPYLLALDVGRTLMVWDRWSGAYGDFHGGQRIHLPTLAERPDDISFLRDIWTNPAARDPRGRSEGVTREIAGHLAQLAASLEQRGHDPEAVARFLIRCVFTMFAEDVDLLKGEPFSRAIEEIGLEDPDEFQLTVSELWAAMDSGSRFGLRKFLRFNGHFFRDQTALPLTHEDLKILQLAARADWSDVEPSIMGTLLTRALDATERHRLGAEYTPREFVERVVRPTVEEPIRERWIRVQAEVLQIRGQRGKGKATVRKREKEAVKSLRSFHRWLCGLRFLDPACGSGNFLYVTLNLVKQVELEVLRAIEEITEAPELAVDEVGPWQFHGIEVKAWAREIAELTLWIGHHQWWRRTHGHAQPREPVLQDTGTLELRDAVLAWDEIREDPERARLDPTLRIPHPVTGRLVPDPEVMLPYNEYLEAKPAEWPAADFIVGNPPYLGNKRMRDAFGDGYVDALRAAYPSVPDSADYVMYWWHRAAEEVIAGRTIRAGLITTNSITQSFNRQVIAHALERGAGVAWAIPTHPWVDEAGSAAVRVAMTVIEKAPTRAVRIEVDESARVIRQVEGDRLNSDLTAHADVAAAAGKPLKANAGLSSRGFTLVGRGFVLEPGEAEDLLRQDPRRAAVIRPYLNGRDLTRSARGVYVIDFGMRTESEAREYPVLYELLRSRVKPGRDANQRKGYRELWWRFGEPRVTLRQATHDVRVYIATPYVAKHRFFTFLEAVVAPDEKIVGIASDSPFLLGVLSSSIHVAWGLAAGSRLGIGNDPTYNNSLCFDSFPFPAATEEQAAAIASLAERLDRHRKDALARDDRLTLTEIYNVVEQLRAGATLTPAERRIHDSAACGVLRDLHDDLDQLVAAAYGWPWPMQRDEILARLVALHDERVEEEKAGLVRWLRPDYQIPRFGEPAEEEATLEFEDHPGVAAGELPAWPESTLEQIAALQAVLTAGPTTVDAAVSSFRGARREHVARHLETLEIMGEAQRGPGGVYQSVRTTAALV
jgi:hypothetical protein